MISSQSARNDRAMDLMGIKPIWFHIHLGLYTTLFGQFLTLMLAPQFFKTKPVVYLLLFFCISVVSVLFTYQKKTSAFYATIGFITTLFLIFGGWFKISGGRWSTKYFGAFHVISNIIWLVIITFLIWILTITLIKTFKQLRAIPIGEDREEATTQELVTEKLISERKEIIKWVKAWKYWYRLIITMLLLSILGRINLLMQGFVLKTILFYTGLGPLIIFFNANQTDLPMVINNLSDIIFLIICIWGFSLLSYGFFYYKRALWYVEGFELRGNLPRFWVKWSVGLIITIAIPFLILAWRFFNFDCWWIMRLIGGGLVFVYSANVLRKVN